MAFHLRSALLVSLLVCVVQAGDKKRKIQEVTAEGSILTQEKSEVLSVSKSMNYAQMRTAVAEAVSVLLGGTPKAYADIVLADYDRASDVYREYVEDLETEVAAAGWSDEEVLLQPIGLHESGDTQARNDLFLRAGEVLCAQYLETHVFKQVGGRGFQPKRERSTDKSIGHWLRSEAGFESWSVGTGIDGPRPADSGPNFKAHVWLPSKAEIIANIEAKYTPYALVSATGQSQKTTPHYVDAANLYKYITSDSYGVAHMDYK